MAKDCETAISHPSSFCMNDSSFCLRGSSGSFRYSEISDALSIPVLLFGIFKGKSLFQMLKHPQKAVLKNSFAAAFAVGRRHYGMACQHLACLYFSFISNQLKVPNATLAAELAHW